MSINNILSNFGLTNNEIKVYLELLSLGNSLAGNIAKKTNIHRRAVYDSLSRLIEKGLVSYSITSRKKYFQAVDPDKLLSIIKEKENEIKSILPELKTRFNSNKPTILSQIYEGKQGIKSVMEDILKANKEWLTIGATGKGLEIIPYYVTHFSKKRQELKIKRKILIAKTSIGKKYAKELEQQTYTKVKFLPKQILNPQTIWIYMDKVITINVSKEHPLLFMIQNKEIADSYRDYFNLLWKKTK